MERPRRHHDVIHAMAEAGFPTPIRGDQGFLTDDGVFVNRLEGFKIATAAGQILHKYGPADTLFSEDMW